MRTSTLPFFSLPRCSTILTFCTKWIRNHCPPLNYLLEVLKKHKYPYLHSMQKEVFKMSFTQPPSLFLFYMIFVCSYAKKRKQFLGEGKEHDGLHTIFLPESPQELARRAPTKNGETTTHKLHRATALEGLILLL